ncbi:MAG: beta-N-acetylglucosaminidase domain-containing protein, partial [Armatimonadota bacterium]
LVKNSATKDDPATIERFAGLLPRYKLNVYALQYHAEQNGTWREPSERYQQVIETVGALAGRDGVLEPALFVCPFFRPRIDLTKQADVELYTDRLRWGVRQGYQWIEVDFNDWAQWQHVTAAEKARFADIGQYWAHLTNSVYEAIRPEFPDVGIIVCATSPWYRGQARPELVTLCRAIPEDVLTYWTGPVTRSRRISAGQVEDWTRATGRKPLLWDNTIYAHFQPYWVGYAFNPFFNTFPPNLPELLAGPGMHLNATAAPHYVPGIMTYADYLWNPEGYDPGRSIRTALRLCWGEEAPDAAQEVQERLVGLYRMLYECGKGWEPYDRAHADAMLSELQEAVTRLADIAGDPALAADMDERFVSAARAAVEQFKPPEKLAPRPEPIARPLSAGAVNPSVEEVVDGKPVGWSLYHGAGVARMSLSPDANSGERSLCIEATRWYQDPTHPTHGDRKWINVALVHGSELGGKEGRDAYDVEPSTSYRCSFYLKGDVPTVHLQYQGWSFMMDSNARESLRGDLEEIRPTGEWQRYTSTFDTDYATKKFALKFALIGYEDEGMRLGSIWVDDVSIEALE